MVEASREELGDNLWVWSVTQYAAEKAARPTKQERYVLHFEDDKRFEVLADCGKWTGKYSYNGRALEMEMNRNYFSGCRKDELMQIFLEDLERARAAFIEGGALQISLADSGGIMYFERD